MSSGRYRDMYSAWGQLAPGKVIVLDLQCHQQKAVVGATTGFHGYTSAPVILCFMFDTDN
jgi:hypothetical protein